MKKISRRVIYEFVLVAVAICGIGYLIQSGINSKLNEAFAENVFRHMNTVSHSIENTLKHNIYELKTIARTIEQGQLSLDNFVSVSKAFRHDFYKSGVVTNYGAPVGESGAVLTQEEFRYIQGAFSGQDVISYHGDKGMIFAVPVTIGGVPCAIYQQFSSDSLLKLFSVESYDGMGRITLANIQEEWIEITESQNDTTFDELYKSAEFREFYNQEVGQKLRAGSTDKVVATYEYNGKDGKKSGVDITVENIEFAGAKKEGNRKPSSGYDDYDPNEDVDMPF